jgi:hypothetical protein
MVRDSLFREAASRRRYTEAWGQVFLFAKDMNCEAWGQVFLFAKDMNCDLKEKRKT